MKRQQRLHAAVILILITLGIFCLLAPLLEAGIFFYGAALLCILSALVLFAKGIRKHSVLTLIQSLCAGALAAVLLAHPVLKTWLIVDLFCLYMLGIVLCFGIQCVLDFRDHTRQRWMHLLLCVLYLLLSVVFFLFRKRDVKILMIFFACYLFLQAFQLILETWVIRHPGLSRDFLFRNWISLPIYLVSFLPGLYLRWISRNRQKRTESSYNVRKNAQPVNLRVFIHTGLSGEHLVGHMTFSYRGIMYSYGNYDKANEKLHGTIGPGVFFSVPADLYISNSCIYEQSVLFEYGIHLTREQEEKLEHLLARVYENTVPWQCPLEQAGNIQENFPAYEHDYASRLWYRTRAAYRKFLSGPWKTYWVMGDNCSLFAENILSRIGCDIVHKSGIVSPGEYFEFFEEAFADPRSNVVFKTWHDASVPESLPDI